MLGTLAVLVVGMLAGGVGILLARERHPTLFGRAAPNPEASEAPPVEGRLVQVARQLMEPGGPSRVIYLNREGASVRGGPDDAAFNVSSVAANAPNNHATIPPFTGTSSRFSAIAKCIRQKFAPFNVSVVESRPVTGDYLMVLMGGTAQDLGFHAEDGHAHSHATGLAPFNGEAIPRAVVFVFTRTLKENLQSSCETAGMEIAHAYGLDHARHCRDLMTYMPRCGARAFLDRDLACGEQADRPCAHGAAVQNSYRRLLSVLGPAPTATKTQ